MLRDKIKLINITTLIFSITIIVLFGALIFSSKFSLPTNTNTQLQHLFNKSANAAISDSWLNKVQKDIENSEYFPSIQTKDAEGKALPANTYHFTNRAQNLRSYINENGWKLQAREIGEDAEHDTWSWIYQLQDLRRGNNTVASFDIPLAITEDNLTVFLDRGILSEWYRNPKSGIEQGFTITEKPSGEGKLVLSAKIDSDLVVNSWSGDQVTFSTDKQDIFSLSKLQVLDAKDQTLPADFSYDKDSRILAILIDDTNAVYPISIDPLATSPSWTAESNQASANYGFSVSSAGDVNADGYSDVIVGASFYDNGETDEGRAYVYLGSPSGLSASSFWTAESNQSGARFGHTVSGDVDINNDGYDDIIVGAIMYDNGQVDEGRVYVYYGSASSLPITANWTAEGDQVGASFGNSVSSAGDVNGDGYQDIVIGAPNYDSGQIDEGKVFVYYGSSVGLSNLAGWTGEGDQISALYGYSVSSAGDVNGDGYDDIMIGAVLYDNGETNEGETYVYYGSSEGLSLIPNWTSEANNPNSSFGLSVSYAGDVNGDGYGDVIVGSPGYDNDQINEGRAYIYYGSSSGLSVNANWMVEGNQLGAQLGIVSTAGDVNGDGYADVIVGALNYDNEEADEGCAYVYYGSSNGLSTDPNWMTESNQSGAQYGISVSKAGDINGDGYSDILVGARFYDNGDTDEGRAYVYLGSASGLSASSSWTAESNQANAVFGYSVSTAGDVNGDGYSDVIIGAIYYDNGESEEGRAYVYLGSASGLSGSSSWTMESNQANAYLGNSVSTAGDVNGDGYSDVIIGAPYYDNGESDEGRAYVYLGSASGLSGSSSWTVKSDQAGARLGNSVSSAGDVNGDGYSDVIIGAYMYDNGESNEGRAYVYLGSASGLSGSSSWTAESNQAGAQFGYSVSTAGDVNGDGYSDVIIGAIYYDNGQSDEGRAYVYLGSASGLSASSSWTAESNQAIAVFGYSVSTAGDVNGDGYSDVIIGVPYYDNSESNEGLAYVYLGSASGLSGSSSWTTESDQMGAYWGISVSTAGDVNGDGYSDVIIGAYYYDNDESDEGRAYVYLGSASGLLGSSSWTAESDQINAYLGRSVSTAGDVNGDGYSDVIVGAYMYDNGESNEGRANVYYGNDQAGLSIRPQQFNYDNSLLSQLGKTTDANTFQISMLAKSYIGGVSNAKLQWEVKPLGTVFDGTDLGISDDWIEIAPTGTTLIERVTGLTQLTSYHWRARILYSTPLITYFSPWFSSGSNGWNETDFRTKIQSYTLNYTAGHGGILTGDASQTVDYGNSGTSVMAVPDEGFNFIKWSDDSTDNPRTDTNVTENIDVTAEFAVNPKGSITINNNDEYTNNSSVTLTLGIIDQEYDLPVTQMMISNNSSFTGANWESYTVTKTWILPTSEGEKTVYAKFKDNVENISEIVSDTIILKTKASLTLDLSLLDYKESEEIYTKDESQPVIIKGKAEQSTKVTITALTEKGTKVYETQLTAGEDGNWEIDLGSVLGVGTYLVQITTTDQAGNVAYSEFTLGVTESSDNLEQTRGDLSQTGDKSIILVFIGGLMILKSIFLVKKKY